MLSKSWPLVSPSIDLEAPNSLFTAGSGKTKTLTARVAYLLSPPLKLQPKDIIVATFTVKASAEMKARISGFIGPKQANLLELGTFHSIARRFLVRHGHLIGLKKDFGIADTADTTAIIKRILKRSKVNGDAKSIRNKISNYKARGDTVDSIQKRAKDGVDFWDTFGAYEEALRIQNQMDYDDLLIKCAELLKKHPHIVENIKAVLVDEFQDTNMIQWELTKLLSSKCKRLTVVGDPDQSIYGFRAAEIGNLVRMKKAFPAVCEVFLEDNYRSSGAIIAVASKVIKQDTTRPDKPLTATHHMGPRPVLRKLPNDGIEAAWIVMEIKRLQAHMPQKLTLDDFAILVRSQSITRKIESQIAKAGMAYRMVGSRKFYERAEVQDVLAYLRVICSPSNTEAVIRIINVPGRKIGETTVKAMVEEADKKKKTLWDFIRQGQAGGFGSAIKLSKPAESGLAEFTSAIIGAQRLLEKNETDLNGVITHILEKVKYRAYLKAKYPEDDDTRWANVEELIQQALELSTQKESDELEDVESTGSIGELLADFLANVALASEKMDNEEGDVPRLTISTMHAAKGLEWPIVFIPSCYSGMIPHSRSEDTDEERRLLYVAMTRAEALLYMSYHTAGTMMQSSAKLSPFLSPKGVQELLDKTGPVFTPIIRRSTLQILGRLPVPSDAEIVKAVDLLPSAKDDLYPEDPDELEEEGEDQSRNKRRKFNEWADDEGGYQRARGWDGAKATVAAGNGTTTYYNVGVVTSSRGVVYNTATFASATTSFTSASTHMRNLQSKSISCEADIERPRVKPFKPPRRVMADSGPSSIHKPAFQDAARPQPYPSAPQSRTASRSRSISPVKQDLAPPTLSRNSSSSSAETTTKPKPKAKAKAKPLDQPSVLDFFKKAPATSISAPRPQPSIDNATVDLTSPTKPIPKPAIPSLKGAGPNSLLATFQSAGSLAREERRTGGFIADLVGKGRKRSSLGL